MSFDSLNAYLKYKNMLPLQIMKIKIIQLVKFFIYVLIIFSLVSLLIHYLNRTASNSKFEYIRIFTQKNPQQSENSLNVLKPNKTKSILLIDDISTFRERDYFCVNKLVNCDQNINLNICPYVPADNLGNH